DMLIVVRFLQALGAGAASVLARAIARDAHEPTDAAKVLSMVAIVTAVGPLLAPLIGGQILRFAGWRGVFVVLAVFGALCAATAYLRVPETWPKERRKSAAVLASLAVALVALTGWGGLWSIVVCLFFVVGVVGILSANCTTDLMHRYPHNAGASAAVFGAMQLALGALASVAIGALADGTPFAMG